MIKDPLRYIRDDDMIHLTEEAEKPFYAINDSVARASLFESSPDGMTRYFAIVRRLRRFLRAKRIDLLIDIDTVLDIFSVPAVRGLGVKLAAWEHFSFYETMGTRIRMPIRKHFTRKADAVVTLTREDKDYFTRAFRGQTRVVQIYNPIIFPRISAEYDDHSKTIVSIGRLAKQKGFDYLIETAETVFARHPDWEWLILGEGEERQTLEAMLAERQLRQVRLIGRVANVEDYLSESAIFVLTSRYEGFPLALVEAKAMGLPAVSFRCRTGPSELIEDGVNFAHLGLAVIDEQHRFGVAQRARLWAKSTQPPHVLVMTATPIPRTLAMTLYGDLDVSVIDELPPGRKPIATLHQFDNRKQQLNAFIRKQVNEGRQIYIVYPLIKESEKIDLKNLVEGYSQVCDDFPDLTVCQVHGQMKPALKDEQMQRFVRGEAQIMVATTVIEVGVNVPNASVMVIQNAERFGLSQLHQLRGRVGRGADQSYCILVTGFKLAEDTRKRIEIMVRTNDGFEIAEADLKLRGPGDLEGTQQSGMAFDLKIADLARDGQILQLARDVAERIIEEDPTCELPKYELLWRQLKNLRKTNVNWSAIS